MADNKVVRTEKAAVEDPDLRNQLAKRLAVAGGLVAILLGMLGLFDYFSQPSDEVDLPVFTQPVPVAPRKMITQPVTTADSLPDAAALPPAVEGGQAQPATVAPPVSATLDEAPPPPVVAAAPAAEMPRSAPSTAKPISRPTSAASTTSAVPASPKAPPAVVPEKTSSPPILPETPRQTEVVRQTEVPRQAEAPPASKTVRVLETTPSTTAAPRRLFSGFVLEAGVFSSAQRAEELHAMLTLSGVPSSIEARVQVGPFKTRDEAMAAQVKLRELGVETLLLSPKGSR